MGKAKYNHFSSFKTDELVSLRKSILKRESDRLHKEATSVKYKILFFLKFFGALSGSSAFLIIIESGSRLETFTLMLIGGYCIWLFIREDRRQRQWHQELDMIEEELERRGIETSTQWTYSL